MRSELLFTFCVIVHDPVVQLACLLLYTISCAIENHETFCVLL